MKRWICLLAFTHSLSAAQQATCPGALAEGATAIARVPAGWTPSTSLARISSGGMMSGPPKKIAYLVPITTIKRHQLSVDVWSFRRGDEKWLWCGYGAESLQLAKRMDDRATECKVTSSRDKHGHLERISVTCK